jgi:ClpP class serine protease
MADAAKKYGLIDDIGSLDDGIKAARKAANLSENCQVVQYDKPVTLLGSLLGIKARQPESVLDPSRLAEGAVPRLWYLTPQSEMAGFLAAMGQKEQP